MVERKFIDPLIYSFTFSHKAVRRLVSGLTDEEMILQFDFEKKHAMWVMGHLAVVRDYVLLWAGRKTLCPEPWGDWFGNNTNSVTGDALVERSVLMGTYEESFHGVIEVLNRLDDDFFSQRISETKHNFSSKREGIAFEVSTHEGLHLGQLQTLVSEIRGPRS